jgi:hypothetical protein
MELEKNERWKEFNRITISQSRDYETKGWDISRITWNEGRNETVKENSRFLARPTSCAYTRRELEQGPW